MQSLNSHLPGLSRKAEETYLENTIKIADQNLNKTKKELNQLSDDIQEMLDIYDTRDKEILTMWNNSVAQLSELKQLLLRSEKARLHPYFGRIDFYDTLEKQEEVFYIGRVGITNGTTNLIVIDWRAPVANAYYENALGLCTYQAPHGKSISIDLKRKRTYEIADDKLLDYYDSDIVANDELLTKYLAKNKKAVLGEIIATIQKEQNLIIRKSPRNNVIVQGVAGSGKTTVAMHRISYILYNYEQEFRPEDFYIIGSNHILLNYITSVLPDLDVYGIRQMTMEQLFTRLLYECWDEKKYQIAISDQGVDKKAAIKGTLTWFKDLEGFCNTYEKATIPCASIYLDANQFREEFHDGKSGIYDRRLKSEIENPKSGLLLLSRTSIENYIHENPLTSMQNKILMLNKRLYVKLENEFTGKQITYSKAEKRAIEHAFRNHFGPKLWKGSIFELYDSFLQEQAKKGYVLPFVKDSYDVYDLAALAYLYKRIKETDPIREAHHIVIDEAQDFGMMAYACLHYCIRGCTYTVMGDVSQNIHFGYGLNDWEELRKLLLTGMYDSFGVLKKSYRNTVEISNFAYKILQHGDFSVYPVEPILRHGNPVRVEKCNDGAALLNTAVETIQSWQADGLETIAIVCRNTKEAASVTELFKDKIQLNHGTLDEMEFQNGVMILPVSYTKGLEFDAVLLFEPTRKSYPTDDGHAKLLYVAATRALHELTVLHLGDLTGLIADPVSKDKQKQAVFDVPEIPAQKPIKKARPLPAKPKPVTSSKMPASKKQGNIAPPASVREVQVPAAMKNTALCYSFGGYPDSAKLRPSGHSRIDLAVRWVEQKKDGIYLRSNYGLLRISPITDRIIRITCSKGQDIAMVCHPAITALDTAKNWTTADSRASLSLKTDTVTVQAEKATGKLSFSDKKNQLYVSSRSKEPFQIDTVKKQTWCFFDWQKKEQLTALSTGTKGRLPLKNTAKYISHSGQPLKLPLLFSNKGYGIVPSCTGPVIFCGLSLYGTYLSTEENEQIDYYFIAGETDEAIYEQYAFLTNH